MNFLHKRKSQNKLNKLFKKMKKVLPKSRYIHSVGVSYTAASMAMKYGEDIESAMTAGILHDCAKSYSGMELLAMCDKYGIVPSDAERLSPDLLHARIGSCLAKDKYKITDPSVLDAIAYHTTGKPDMTTLEKILYIADYIEPQRNKVSNLKEIRHLAFEDLDECIIVVTENTIKYLKDKKADIDPVTQSTLDFYKEKKAEK